MLRRIFSGIPLASLDLHRAQISKLLASKPFTSKFADKQYTKAFNHDVKTLKIMVPKIPIMTTEINFHFQKNSRVVKKLSSTRFTDRLFARGLKRKEIFFSFLQNFKHPYFLKNPSLPI